VFGLAHGDYGFTAAFFGGMILGWIYLRSGVESSIAAHFAANFLFFTASYLF
jgi:membrane protease YdiL (CAAX protease family)